MKCTFLFGFVFVSLIAAGCEATRGGEGRQRSDVPTVPDWAADAVFYQIFPERFRNGDPSNDPTRESLDEPHTVPESWRVSSWTGDWYARSDWEKAMSDDFYEPLRRRRYGGDLAGVIEKLEYLADLGINTIYFNPLFYARSLHKYDGNTYHHIDPYFGPDPDGDLQMMAEETADPETWQWTAADSLFLELLAEASGRNIRVVIDGVWNHTGRDFFAFVDVRQRGEESPYKDWYIIHSFDDPATPEDEFDHQGWWGHKPLPEFADTPDGKDLHPGPKKYVFDATRRWMDPNADGDPSDGIAGWRLDVVPDMPIGFWADWNAYVRGINPDAYTVAEIWHDAAGDVRRGGFSSTMNYHAFAMPVKGFLVDRQVSGSEFVDMLKDRAAIYDAPNRFALLNLVDSHDTPRIASMIVNRESRYTEPDVFDYDRDGWGGEPSYDVRKPNEMERRIQRMIALVQATHVGAPMIYYGTEAGMWGADDPDDRMPTTWDDMQFDVQASHPYGRTRPADTVAFDHELFAFYRRAFGERHGREVLRRGGFDAIGTSDSDGVAAFVRRLESDAAVVVMNRDEDAQTIEMEKSAIGWTGASVALSASADGDVRVSDDGVTLAVELQPLTAALLVESDSSPVPSGADE